MANDCFIERRSDEGSLAKDTQGNLTPGTHLKTTATAATDNISSEVTIPQELMNADAESVLYAKLPRLERVLFTGDSIKRAISLRDVTRSPAQKSRRGAEGRRTGRDGHFPDVECMATAAHRSLRSTPAKGPTGRGMG